MKKIWMTITILLLQISQLSQTAQSTLQKNTWYIGSKCGLPRYNNIITYIDQPVVYNNIYDAIHNSPFVFGSFIGYQNNKYFSFELSYNWLGKITYTNEKIDNTFKIQNIDISTKLYYPIITRNHNINTYTKFGGTIWHANIKTLCHNNGNTYYANIYDTNLSPLIGIGIEHQITKHWKTRIEYQKIYKIGNINTIGAQSNHILFNVNIIYCLYKYKFL